MNLLEEF